MQCCSSEGVPDPKVNNIYYESEEMSISSSANHFAQGGSRDLSKYATGPNQSYCKKTPRQNINIKIDLLLLLIAQPSRAADQFR